jgi:hypothetical protein
LRKNDFEQKKDEIIGGLVGYKGMFLFKYLLK